MTLTEARMASEARTPVYYQGNQVAIVWLRERRALVSGVARSTGLHVRVVVRVEDLSLSEHAGARS